MSIARARSPMTSAFGSARWTLLPRLASSRSTPPWPQMARDLIGRARANLDVALLTAHGWYADYAAPDGFVEDHLTLDSLTLLRYDAAPADRAVSRSSTRGPRGHLESRRNGRSSASGDWGDDLRRISAVQARHRHAGQDRLRLPLSQRRRLAMAGRPLCRRAASARPARLALSPDPMVGNRPGQRLGRRCGVLLAPVWQGLVAARLEQPAPPPSSWRMRAQVLAGDPAEP